jgi:hypothetical protein
MVNSAKTERAYKGGFVRGTLVSMREGLRPIEAIQVGDYVLSSPGDDAGRATYQRVRLVSRHEGQHIRQLIVDGDTVGKGEMIAASDNTPFWVVGAGWTRADQLDRRMTLRRSDGTECGVVRQYPVYRTDVPGVGWTQSMSGNVELSHGNRYDYANAKGLPMGGFDDILSKDVLNSDQPFLSTTVYGIGVEVFHNFYVGKQRVWVRQVFDEARD